MKIGTFTDVAMPLHTCLLKFLVSPIENYYLRATSRI